MSEAREGLVERLRQERRPTAWTRGLDTDYPTAWEPNLLCHEAAAEIVRLACLVDAVRGAFNREVDDADAILRTLGLDPENCRTDGGALKMWMMRGVIEHRDEMTRREARKKEREQCAALCEGLARVMTPDRRSTAEDLARAIREDQP